MLSCLTVSFSRGIVYSRGNRTPESNKNQTSVYLNKRKIKKKNVYVQKEAAPPTAAAAAAAVEKQKEEKMPKARSNIYVGPGMPLNTRFRAWLDQL